MIDKVRQYIRKHNLIPSSVAEVIAAVSGGVDSCVLLNVLSRLQSEFKYKLIVVHFNHKVRGKASDDDEQFVLNLARKYGLMIEHSQLSSKAIRLGETYLRMMRYNYYHEVLSNHPHAIIATGHHRDDAIETFFMRLLQGSRLKGLRSILPKRDRFIHPMLAISRKEIEQYAKMNKIEYKQDLTNFNSNIRRNLIRNKILPFLELEWNDGIRNNLVKVIEDFSCHYQIYNDQLKKEINQSITRSNKQLFLNKKKYNRLNQVIRRGLIEYCISFLYPLNYGISESNFKLWDDFIKRAATGKIFTFKKDLLAVAEREFILFGFQQKINDRKYELKLSHPIIIDNIFEISLRPVDKDEICFNLNRNEELIDGDKSGKKLIVRFWKKGDKFKPLGMNHYRKLSDFFIDLKLSRCQKMAIPIVCKDNKIIWIAGYRLDERFKISENTRIIYKLQLIDVH